MSDMEMKVAPARRSASTIPAAASTRFAQRALWFNTIVLSVVTGACCGLGLMLLTYLSLALTGEHAGYYLNLIGVFFPGYSASPLGAWIGGFWAFVFAAISSAVVFQVYARAISMNFSRSMSFDHDGKAPPSQLVILVSARAFGIAIGAILALQLLVSTLWLVITGQGPNSDHAALLSNYLPFYSVTTVGALVGAVDIFVYGFVFAYIFAFIYNFIVKKTVG